MSLLFLAFSCWLTVQPGNAATVRLEWRIIAASHRKGNMDPRLRDIYRDLGTIFNYQSYKLINANQIALSEGQSASISLPGKKQCTIKITHVSTQWVNVQIHITQNGRSTFGTTARLMNGRTLLIGGPSSHTEALIFSLRSFW